MNNDNPDATFLYLPSEEMPLFLNLYQIVQVEVGEGEPTVRMSDGNPDRIGGKEGIDRFLHIIGERSMKFALPQSRYLRC
jgi:hypothetical protein